MIRRSLSLRRNKPSQNENGVREMNIIVCLFVRLLAGSVVSHLPNAREFVRVANEAINVAHENAIREAKEVKLKSELEAQGVRVAGGHFGVGARRPCQLLRDSKENT